MFIVETVYVYVVSILFASSGLDERQEDDSPEIGQDIKPKMVLSCGIHIFSLEGCLASGDSEFCNYVSALHKTPLTQF